jgi:hypothetical protein
LMHEHLSYFAARVGGARAGGAGTPARAGRRRARG